MKLLTESYEIAKKKKQNTLGLIKQLKSALILKSFNELDIEHFLNEYLLKSITCVYNRQINRLWQMKKLIEKLTQYKSEIIFSSVLSLRVIPQINTESFYLINYKTEACTT